MDDRDGFLGCLCLADMGAKPVGAKTYRIPIEVMLRLRNLNRFSKGRQHFLNNHFHDFI
jgi:hypothetical protein